MPEEKTKPGITLTTRQKQFLKGLAHSLNPLVQIGKEGLSDRLIETVDIELSNHELIKIKIGSNSGLDKNSSSETLVEQTAAALVQLIGKTIVLYRPNPEKPKDKRIILPKAK